MTQIVFLTTLLAVWQNPTPIYVGPGDQTIDVVISDGEGGAAVIWWDDVTEWNYMQVIDSAGNLKWDSEGVPIIATAGLSTQDPDVFQDDEGNYWVALEGNEDIYVQKLSPTGQRLFGDDGVIVCNEETEESYPRLCPSGEGAIITWLDYRSQTLMDLIFAQRVGSDGSTKWIDNGIQICDSTPNQPQRFADPVQDGNNGAIVILMKRFFEEGDNYVFAQRLDSLGNRLWEDTCYLIHKGTFSPLAKAPLSKNAFSDGVSSTIFFYKEIGGYWGQKVDTLGNVLWGVDGVNVGADDYSHFGSTSLLSSEGIYVVRGETEANEAVYANRVTPDGEIPWGPIGNVIWEVWAYNPRDDIIPYVTEHGIIVWRDVWDDGPSGERYEQRGLLAQRVDTLGDILWTEEVLVAGTSSSNPRVIGTNDKAGIVLWHQGGDLYSTRIDSLGNLPPGITEDMPQIAPLQLDVVGGSVCLNQAELRFSLPHEVTANLTVYDAMGCKVKELSINNGQRATWDGYDYNHSLCPTGVYFVRLDVPNLNSSAGAKVILLR